MHMINKKNRSKGVIKDHTLIIKELVNSLKLHGWDLILPFLPKDSFLVGGYVRDVILGRLNTKVDVDIVVYKNAIDIGKEIANNLKGKFIILDKDREVIRVILNDISIDIATKTSSCLEEDLKSRDFSINAIAFSFDNNCLIDPLGGIKDIEFSILKTYSKTTLVDDPLRILRCFRFVSELNFKIDMNLRKFIREYKNELRTVAKERINYEIQRIIKGKNAFEAVYLINKYDLFNLNNIFKDSFLIDLRKIDYSEFNDIEKDNFLPLFFLTQLLDDSSLKKYNFSKSEIIDSKLIRKWHLIITKKKLDNLDEDERFDLHKELERILPSFVFYLPQRLHSNWLSRWRDNEDKLFHPKNFINGDIIKKQLNLKEGPIFGKLLLYLSKELAFDRLDNFDEAIYKAKQWIEQNAPKCD